MTEFILRTRDRRQHLAQCGHLATRDAPPMRFYSRAIAKRIAAAQPDLTHLIPDTYDD